MLNNTTKVTFLNKLTFGEVFKEVLLKLVVAIKTIHKD